MTFKKELSTTTYRLQIVQLIDQKKKEGSLRTQSEIDEFWREIRKPKVFKRRFPPSHSGILIYLANAERKIHCIR